MIGLLIIVLIYITGVFAAIALTAYLWADEIDGNEELVMFFSILSWIFVVATLLMFIVSILLSYVFAPIFFWFYNKCKERFRNKKK